MSSLPIFQDKSKNFMLHQTSWKAALTPVLTNELNQGIMLKNLSLKTGVNVINHLLSRTQQGWILLDLDSNASIYRSAPLNDKTLTLTSSANCVIALWVF